MVEMAMITLVVGSVGLLAAGVVGVPIWRHRASSLQRVPVRADRPVHVVRGA